MALPIPAAPMSLLLAVSETELPWIVPLPKIEVFAITVTKPGPEIEPEFAIPVAL